MANAEQGPPDPNDGQAEDDPDEEKKASPLLVWPWLLFTADPETQSLLWRQAFMLGGFIFGCAGVMLCKEVNGTCYFATGIAFLSSFMAQNRVFRIKGLKRIEQGIVTENNNLDDIKEDLDAGVQLAKKIVEAVDEYEDELVEVVEEIKAKSQLSTVNTLAYTHTVSRLETKSVAIADKFKDIEYAVDRIYRADGVLKDEVDAICQNIGEIREKSEQMSEDISAVVDLHQRLTDSKTKLGDELRKFNEMRQQINSSGRIWAANVFDMASTLQHRYDELVSLSLALQSSSMKELAHNIEHMDGMPGWTWEKFVEFLSRLPQNVRAAANLSHLRFLFRQLRGESLDGIVEYEDFEFEILQKELLPLRDVFKSGADEYSSNDEDPSLDADGTFNQQEARGRAQLQARGQGVDASRAQQEHKTSAQVSL